MNRRVGYSRFLLTAWILAAIAVGFSTSATTVSGHYWTDVRPTVSIHNIATDGQIYVAGGGGIDGNGLWISTDLQSWKRARLPVQVSARITSVAYEKGLFIAVANTVITSSDGIHWSVADVPSELVDDYSAIARGNGMYVIVGENASNSQALILTSSDGKTWKEEETDIAAPPDNGETVLDGIVWSGTRFVAVGADVESSAITNLVITSIDGRMWKEASLPSGGSGGSSFTTIHNNVLAFGNGTFVAGGGMDLFSLPLHGTIYTSTDGMHWAAEKLPGQFVATGVQFVHGFFVAPGYTESDSSKSGYLVSTDGNNWTFRSVDPGKEGLELAAFLYSGGRYTIAGEAGVWSSSDLSNWTRVFTGSQSNGMYCLGHGEEVGYVLLGMLSNEVLMSSNGRDWPDKLTPISTSLADTGASQGYSDGCIAHGARSYVSNNFHSTEGTTWAASTHPRFTDIRLVANNGSKYLAIGAVAGNNRGDYVVLESNDGAAWKKVTSNLPHLAVPDALQVLDGRFFLTAQNGKPGWDILTSRHGKSWIDVTPPVSASGFPHIGFGNGALIAMWSDNDEHLKIARSMDEGEHWTVEGNVFQHGLSFLPVSVAYGGGVYLAVGHMYQSNTGAYLVSNDGTHWTFAIDNRIGPFKTLLWDGSKFIATGALDVLNSPGGMPGVLLSIGAKAPASVKAGKQFSLKLTVSNGGSVRATGTNLEDTLPASVTLVSATPSQGKCKKSGGALSCALGMLKIGADATVTLKLAAGSSAGDAVNKASVHADQPMGDGAQPGSSTTVKVTGQQQNTGGISSSGNSSGGGGGAFGFIGLAGLLALGLRRRLMNSE
jgi:uncharacterized repeat protein (TIGR01451 family)